MFFRYYRSFINGSAKLAPPLTQLLKKGVLIHWNALQERSFNDLNEVLIKTHVFAFPDYELPFVMHKDISALGVCAVMMWQDARDEHRTVTYVSYTEPNRIELHRDSSRDTGTYMVY